MGKLLSRPDSHHIWNLLKVGRVGLLKIGLICMKEMFGLKMRTDSKRVVLEVFQCNVYVYIHAIYCSK